MKQETGGSSPRKSQGPLEDLDHWDEFLQGRGIAVAPVVEEAGDFAVGEGHGLCR